MKGKTLLRSLVNFGSRKKWTLAAAFFATAGAVSAGFGGGVGSVDAVACVIPAHAGI